MKFNGALAVFSISLAFGAFADGLKISEICPRPTALDPNGLESGWVELYNDSDAAVDLADYELVRANRGKALAASGRTLCARSVPAHGYTLVYMSEAYANALDKSSADYNKVALYANGVMVCPTRIAPKNFPLVALFRGQEEVDRLIVPVDLPDNQSIARSGGCFASYASGQHSDTPSSSTELPEPVLLDLTGKVSVDSASGVTYSNGVYDFSAVTDKKTGVKVASSVTDTLAATNCWSASLWFRMTSNKASSADGGVPLLFCRTSASTPKSGVVLFINNAGLIRLEVRDPSGSPNKKFDADSERDWLDGAWHKLEFVYGGATGDRLAIAVDGETLVESTTTISSPLRTGLPFCIGHAYDSTYWDVFNGQVSNVTFATGSLISRDSSGGSSPIAGPVTSDYRAVITAPANVHSVILPSITPGASNVRTGELPYGPNVGPLYGERHSFSDLQPTPPAAAGQPYAVTLAVNPLSDREEDAISGVTLVYRSMVNGAYGATNGVAMVKGDYVDGQGQLWTAQIPAAAVPAAGNLLQWSVLISEASGNRWRSPSFRDVSDSYEWYGTIVEPTSSQISATLPTWHLFADSTARGNMDKQYDNIRGSLPNGARIGIYDSQTSTYYDNVRIDLRGNTTANMTKKSHGLRFNKCQPMVCRNPFDGEAIETRKTSLLAEFADPSRLRAALSSWIRRAAGQDVPFCYPIRTQLNGAFFQLAHHTNRFTDEMLGDYYGYDLEGYAFKNIGTAGGANTSGGMSVVLPEDLSAQSAANSALQSFQNSFSAVANNTPGRSLTADQEKTVTKAVVKQFDLPAWINFLALARITQECDDGWANLSVYYDRLGTGQWRPMAYDLHQSWGAYYYSDNYGTSKFPWSNDDIKGKCHPLYGGMHVVTAIRKSNATYGNRAYEAVYQSEKFRRLHLRRLRTIMDRHFGAPGTSKENTAFWRDYAAPLVAAMQADDLLDRAKWPQQTGLTIYVWPGTMSFAQGVDDIWDNYVVPRRVHLFNTHSVTNTAKAIGYANELNAGIPLEQSPIESLKAGFSVEAVEGGAVIRNANEETVDLSGWKLSGPVEMRFPAGTVIDQRLGSAPGELFVVTDRMAYIAANDSILTNQVIVGNAKTGSSADFMLKDDEGEIVIGVPVPDDLVLTGDYADPVVLNTSIRCILDGANLAGGLVVQDGLTVKLAATSNSVNSIASISAPASEVRFTGDGKIGLSGTDTLAVVSNLVVKSGVLEIRSAGVAATKTPLVRVLGFAEQTGGTIDLAFDVATTNQIYGIFLANKDPKDATGANLGLVYARFDGGDFNAVVGATKSSAVYVDKGSVVATFKGGQTITAVLKGAEPRFISSAGDIEFKRCSAQVSMPNPTSSMYGARVFKTDKRITVSDGHYVADVQGPDAEIFSSADRITISGGTFELVSSDDCFSAMNRIAVSGGLFHAVSTSDDVFDSNGDMEITGGTIMAYTAAEGHEAFDVDPEETASGSYDHQLRIEGGTIFATGGKNSDWPDDLVVSDGLVVFAEEDLDSSAYSGRYLSLLSDYGVKTTAKLPVFRQSKCAVLATCPALSGQPETSSAAPTAGSQDFHDLYVESVLLTHQEDLRFLEIYGATKTNALETTGDVGEYIVLTNISDKVVTLAGLKVNVEKLADWDSAGELSSKCLFILTQGTVAPHGSVRLEQSVHWAGSKQKITNGELHIGLTDSVGNTIQYGKASFDGSKYPLVNYGGASLVAIRFDVQMKDNADYWSSSVVFDAPDPGDLGTFSHAVTFTVDGYTGTGSVERFPVLVRLRADSPQGFDYSMVADDASDLCFADDASNPLPFEIEKWNPSGESLVWVSLPVMTNGTTFAMFFGGESAVENDPKEVWTDYVGVWHMSEASGTVKDSTGNGLDAVPAGSAASASVAVDGGPVGSARQFASSQGKGLTYLLVPNYDSFGLADNFTIQGWFKASACATSYSARYISRKTGYQDNNGWEFEQRYGDVDTAATTVSCRGATSGDFTQTVPDIRNAWLDLAVNYSGKSVQYYVNGAVGSAVTINAAATDNGKQLSIGCNPEGTESNWMGQMDEIRLRKGDVTADRMLAEHETIAKASFLAASPVLKVKNTTWDVPGETGGIRALTDAQGGKYVRFRSISLQDGRLVLDLEADCVDADGQTFTLLCKENLTDAETFTIDVTLENGATQALGTLQGLVDLPRLFILGIGPAAK